MKKHCILLTCMAFVTVQAAAQQSRVKINALPGKSVLSTPAKSLAKMNKGKSTAKITDALRLSAITRYNIATAPASLIDSTHYTYSGSRGWNTDNPVSWDIADYYVVPATPGQKYVQTFDAHDNILSLTVMTADGAGGWSNNSSDTFTYDAADNILKHVAYQWDGGSGWSMISDMHYYYSGDLLDSTISAIYFLGIHEESVRDVYTYNTRGIAATMIESTLDLPAAAWEPSLFVSRDFNPADELVLSEKTSEYTGGAWEDVSQCDYTYDASGNMVSASMMRFDGADWVEYRRILNEYNTSDKLTESLAIDMDADPSMPDSSRDSYSYNAADLITDITTETMDHSSSSFIPRMKSSYYYDEKVTSIATINRGGSLSVYPVPANNELILDLQWDKVQKASVSVCDLQGRIWQQWTLPAVQQYKEQVALNNLPAGNYVIRISGSENARVTQPFTVLR